MTDDEYCDRILAMSPDELVAECLRLGIDPDQTIEDIDTILAKAISSAHRRN